MYSNVLHGNFPNISLRAVMKIQEFYYFLSALKKEKIPFKVPLRLKRSTFAIKSYYVAFLIPQALSTENITTGNLIYCQQEILFEELKKLTKNFKINVNVCKIRFVTASK